MVKKLVFLIMLIQSMPILHAIPKGIPNCGAACYLNSVTQCLYNINELTTLFLSMGTLPKPAESLSAPEKFPYAYQQLLFKLRETPRVLQRNDLILKQYQTASFAMMTPVTGQQANTQEDAQEFFAQAFNALRKTNDAIDTFISHNLFGFIKEIKTTFPIPDMPPIISSKTAEPEYYLTIPIKTPGTDKELTSLQESLDEYFKEEIFNDPKNYLSYQGDDPAYYAYQGALIPNATKKTELVNAPNLLILSLNRFEFDDYGQRKKLKHSVNIPDQLNMSKYVKETFNSESYDYDLLNVVVHKGKAEGGHYIAYVKDNNQWYMCNDSEIIPTDFQQMNDPHNSLNIQIGAYILFYKKRESHEPSSSIPIPLPNENLKRELTNLNNTLNLLEKQLQKD